MNTPAPMLVAHLDLKYLMPAKRYLLHWVRRLGERGFDALLLEYEDKFPFDRHRALRHPLAFTPAELRTLLETAREAGLRVIPLVPTLSHLEFALSRPQFAGLREAPDIPTQICPSNPSAVSFVNALLDDVLAAHEQDEWVHLGADEAWFLGSCPTCRARMNGDGTRLWADHMRPLIARMQAAGKRVKIWDDIFWKRPDAVREAGLPAGTTLVLWDYGSRTFPAGGRTDQRIESYRAAGLQTAGAPCLNWGVLTPRHEQCLHNVTAWAGAVRRQHMTALINPSWSCFHVPLPMQSLYEAAAAAALHGTADPRDEDWQAEFLEQEFGVTLPELTRAFAGLGTTWEHPVEGFSRPISPLVYGYMDMVLYYADGQDERQRRGHYPPDWHAIDFDALFMKKLHLLREAPAPNAVSSTLATLEAAYAQAAPVMAQLARRAVRHRREAELLACFADLKLLSARAVSELLRDGDTSGAKLDDALALRKRLNAALTPFYESAGRDLALRLWIDPLIAVLRFNGVPAGELVA